MLQKAWKVCPTQALRLISLLKFTNYSYKSTNSQIGECAPLKIRFVYQGRTISLQIIALEVVREVVGNVGNCFRAQNHVQWQITNRQKLLAWSSLDEGFN